MFDMKEVFIVALLIVIKVFGSVKSAPLVQGGIENDNFLREQAILKSQYETFPKNVIPLYYMARRGYDYERPKIPFGNENIESGELVDAFEGYVYNRPEEPFTYPPRTTTQRIFPPATARIIKI